MRQYIKPKGQIGGPPLQRLYELSFWVTIRGSWSDGCQIVIGCAPLTYIVILSMYDGKDCVIFVSI